MTTPPPGQAPAWSAAPPSSVGPAAGLAYGGFWIRALALILDALILGVLSSALLPLTGIGTMVEIEPNRFVVNYGANAVSTLLGLVYFIGFWSLRGQTPGMMPFNMKVVRADDGGPVDLVRGLLRYVGLIISFAAILLGVIWVAFDSRKQGWHDKIAGTVVVRAS
jgi:uncharacterized RDD family membrane protein YckC